MGDVLMSEPFEAQDKLKLRPRYQSDFFRKLFTRARERALFGRGTFLLRACTWVQVDLVLSSGVTDRASPIVQCRLAGIQSEAGILCLECANTNRLLLQVILYEWVAGLLLCVRER
jgi:hypothetical protein